MAHKTFISYKYSESVKLRDRIIANMGENAEYYNGENGFSPNKSDDSDNSIWEYLKDMIWNTTVTIVILSPEMCNSSWIKDEISYSLKKISRDGTTSHMTAASHGTRQHRNGTTSSVQLVTATSYDTTKTHYYTAYPKATHAATWRFISPKTKARHGTKVKS